MKLLVGLGNPGKQYTKTRHNVGWRVLDALVALKSQISMTPLRQGSEGQANNQWEMADKFNAEVLKTENFILAKPQTFMNESGKAVKKLVDFYKIDLDDLYVIHDDLDIRLGEYKIQKGKGPKVHNGILSVEGELGKSDFWRVRVGVDNRVQKSQIQMTNDQWISGEEYVLTEFNEEEMKIMEKVIQKVVQDFPALQ